MGFITTFTLKQHTPIIHFQHRQRGATLRATELKPKFDKFILEKIGGLEKVKAEHKDWLIGEGKHPAFDYEVTIQNNSEKSVNIDDRFPLFFGNLENENENRDSRKKYAFKMAVEDFTVTLFSLHTDLMVVLKNNFQAFLFHTNFGTRQSKGFGSFTVVEGGTNFNPSGIPFFKVNSGDKEILFRTIALFYKAIRSGVNGFTKLRNGKYFYMKPYIFAYAKENGIQWDKKTVKQKFYPRLLEDEIIKHSTTNRNGEVVKPETLAFESEKAFDVKDLLGLSTSEQWKLPDNRGKYSQSFMINKETTSSKVDRFQSPITFKPVLEGSGYKVYIFLHEIPESYTEASVKFSNQKGGHFTLPLWKDFKIKDFFEFVLRTDPLDLIPADFHRNDFTRELQRIIKELKSSYKNNG